MIVEHDELISAHKAREALYSFFSQLYLMMPGEKLYARITDFLPVLRTVADNINNDESIQAAETLENFFETREKLSAQELADYDLEALRKYTSLLCLGKSVPVNESIYTSSQNLLMQEARDEMVVLLKKYSLSQTDGIREFEDHISVELLFMAKLIRLSIEALQNNDEEVYLSLLCEQLNMYKNHFDKWVGEFVSRILSFDLAEGEIIYRSCSKLMLNFMNEDKQIIEELL